MSIAASAQTHAPHAVDEAVCEGSVEDPCSPRSAYRHSTGQRPASTVTNNAARSTQTRVSFTRPILHQMPMRRGSIRYSVHGCRALGRASSLGLSSSACLSGQAAISRSPVFALKTAVRGRRPTRRLIAGRHGLTIASAAVITSSRSTSTSQPSSFCRSMHLTPRP